MRKQKTPSEFGFSDHDKKRLHKAMLHVSDKRTYLRMKAVLLVAEGYKINAVSKIIDKSFQIIYQWIDAYLANHQIEALYDAPRSGRPSTIKDVTDKQIMRALGRNPLILGYQSTMWTVALLTDYLSKHYSCSISARTLYRRMKQIGLECKRPRYVYDEKDPHRAQKKGRSSES